MRIAMLFAALAGLLGPAPVAGQNIPSPTGEERFLSGRLCSFAGGSPSASSSYSRTRWAVFDGKGAYQYGSETAFSSGAGMAYGGGARGRGVYRIQGGVIYLIDADGSVDTARVHMRQNDGRITEVMFGRALYAQQLCQ